MNNHLKKLRIEIQNKRDITLNEFAKETEMSVRSLYRIEDQENFKNSIFIKYLNYLRENKVNVNQVLKEVFEQEKEK